jgi:hypothetical protein
MSEENEHRRPMRTHLALWHERAAVMQYDCALTIGAGSLEIGHLPTSEAIDDATAPWRVLDNGRSSARRKHSSPTRECYRIVTHRGLK